MEVTNWDEKKMIAAIDVVVNGFNEDLKLIKTGQLTQNQTLNLLEQHQFVFIEVAENMKYCVSAFASLLESFNTMDVKLKAMLDLTPGTCRNN